MMIIWGGPLHMCSLPLYFEASHHRIYQNQRRNFISSDHHHDMSVEGWWGLLSALQNMRNWKRVPCLKRDTGSRKNTMLKKGTPIPSFSGTWLTGRWVEWTSQFLFLFFGWMDIKKRIIQPKMAWKNLGWWNHYCTHSPRIHGSGKRTKLWETKLIEFTANLSISSN